MNNPRILLAIILITVLLIISVGFMMASPD